MKTTIIASPLVTSDDMQGSVMGMDASGMATAQMFLRDKIYSNKTLAVVREYICNAIDEHSKYNVDRAVQTGLRKEDNESVFFVRDFANGLSEHDIRNVFGMYFRSTKSSTNNSIGGFGIGSKAGHCYNDTFFVTSYFKGEKITYTCMLGGGEDGIPVGHIYEINRAETSENGLEISIPINDFIDINRFEKEIGNFVAHSPANIEYLNFDNDIYISPKAIYEKQINEFNFRLIENTQHVPLRRRNIAVLQMGGVNYGVIDFIGSGYCVKTNHTLIIDIPIGSMTLPISRESFEDTPKNNKIKENILNVTLNLAQEDLVHFKNKTLLEVLKDSLAGLKDDEYFGDIFSARKSTLFKDFWQLINHTRESNADGVFQKIKGKHVLVIIPDKHSKIYWSTKLKDFSKNTNRNYYYVNEYTFNKVTVDLSQDFQIVKVEKLDYPKIPRDNKRYAVHNYHTNLGSFSPLELHNYMRTLLKLNTAQDEKEAVDQNKQFLSTVSTFDDLKNIVIVNRNSTAKSRNNITYYSCSIVFIKAMRNLGWIDYNSLEYKTTYAKVLEIRKKADEFEASIAMSKRRWVKFSDRTCRLIENNNRNALRFSKFWQCLNRESSFRSKMIISFDHSYRTPVMNRSELRQILKLK